MSPDDTPSRDLAERHIEGYSVHAPIPTLPTISRQIWDAKYRLKTADGAPVDLTLADTWRRVAGAIAAAEPEADRERWAKTFFEVMADLGRAHPGGRRLGPGRHPVQLLRNGPYRR
jgi:ribonucleotide reductase alpha subunit